MLNMFADGFYEATGGDRLLVTSAYRTLEYQQRVYDEYVSTYGEEMARIYVADPGNSEHHTGLAVDLSTMSRDGERIPLIEHAHFDWVTSHCADYGFILRYPVGSEEITHVAYEPWHFRYVGIAAAKACTELGMLYEEFIEHIKTYTVDSGVLYLSFDENGGVQLDVAYFGSLPETGVIFYYVPADTSGRTEFPVPLPPCGIYVSADNDGGFIIEVGLGE